MLNRNIAAVVAVLACLRPGFLYAQAENVTFVKYGLHTGLTGINSAGRAVGLGTRPDGTRVGIVVDGQRITELTPPGGGIVVPSAINDRNDMVGQIVLPTGGIQAFLYRSGIYTPLPGIPPFNFVVEPKGINNQGVIAGYGTTDAGMVGWTFTFQRGYQTFQVAPGVFTQAHGINDRGDIVGGSALGALNGFVRKDGAFYLVDFPESLGSLPTGINNEGVIVGIASFAGEAPNRRIGFLLDAAGYHEILSLPGLQLTVNEGLQLNQLAINDRGDVAGRGDLRFLPRFHMIGFIRPGRQP